MLPLRVCVLGISDENDKIILWHKFFFMLTYIKNGQTLNPIISSVYCKFQLHLMASWLDIIL